MIRNTDDVHEHRRILRSRSQYMTLDEIRALMHEDDIACDAELAESLASDPLVVCKFDLFRYCWIDDDNSDQLLSILDSYYSNTTYGPLEPVERIFLRLFQPLSELGITNASELSAILKYLGFTISVGALDTSDYLKIRDQTHELSCNQSTSSTTVEDSSKSSLEPILTENQCNAAEETSVNECEGDNSNDPLSQAVQYIKDCNRTLLKKTIEDNLKILDESTFTALANHDDIICTNRMYRYRKSTGTEIHDLAVVFGDSLMEDTINTEQEYTNHKAELTNIGILNVAELSAIISKFCPESKTTALTRFKSKPFRELFKIADQKSDNNTAPSIISVHNLLTTEYRSLNDIIAQIADQSGCADVTTVKDELLQEPFTLFRMPDYFRTIDLNPEDLDGLLIKASKSIRQDSASFRVVFNSVISDCFLVDIRNEEELGQIISKNRPEYLGVIANRIYFNNTTQNGMTIRPESETSGQMRNVAHQETSNPIQTTYAADDDAIIQCVTPFLNEHGKQRFTAIARHVHDSFSISDTALRAILSRMVESGDLALESDTYIPRKPENKNELSLIFSSYHDSVYSAYKLFDLERSKVKPLGYRTANELAASIDLIPDTKIIESTYKLVSFNGMTIERLVGIGLQKHNSKELIKTLFYKHGIPVRVTKEAIEKYNTDSDDKKCNPAVTVDSHSTQKVSEPASTRGP